MREYARVAPQFWTGDTGRQIRALGPDAQRVALYLMTCPSSNMIGLYYLPVPTLAHEVGHVPPQGAREVLRSLEKAGFCFYDDVTEVVWVQEMARFQIADRLKPNDKQVAGIMAKLVEFKNNRFSEAFYGYYRERFNLPAVTWWATPRRGSVRPSVRTSEAPPMPEHRAQSTGTEGRPTVAPAAATAPEGPEGPEGFVAPMTGASDVARLVNEYARQFYARFGVAAATDPGRDGGVAKRLLKNHTVAALERCLPGFFELQDKLIDENGYTMPMFSQRISKLIVQTLGKNGRSSTTVQRMVDKAARAADLIRESQE